MSTRGNVGVITNNGDNTYVEKFRNDTITIPPHANHEMELSEAVLFMGRHPGTENGATRAKPLSLRRVFAEKITESFISHKDGKSFSSQAELDEHEKQFASEAIKPGDPMYEESEKALEKKTVVYSCAECDFDAKSRPGLVIHIKAKHGKP